MNRITGSKVATAVTEHWQCAGYSLHAHAGLLEQLQHVCVAACQAVVVLVNDEAILADVLLHLRVRGAGGGGVQASRGARTKVYALRNNQPPLFLTDQPATATATLHLLLPFLLGHRQACRQGRTVPYRPLPSSTGLLSYPCQPPVTMLLPHHHSSPPPLSPL